MTVDEIFVLIIITWVPHSIMTGHGFQLHITVVKCAIIIIVENLEIIIKCEIFEKFVYTILVKSHIFH